MTDQDNGLPGLILGQQRKRCVDAQGRLREHVRRWAFERTKDDALRIVIRGAYKEDRVAA